MLPRSQRVSARQFSTLKGSQAPFNGRLFSLKRYGGGAPHIAVVVSKKTARKASVRNRIRRRVYALVAPLVTHGTGTVVIFPKGEALRAKTEDIRAELEQAFSH